MKKNSATLFLWEPAVPGIAYRMQSGAYRLVRADLSTPALWEAIRLLSIEDQDRLADQLDALRALRRRCH